MSEKMNYTLEDVIEEDMIEALQNGDFKVYFQPKINMLTSHIYGAEALSRWVHKNRGIIPPDSYIPMFEQNGFITMLDRYVFQKVCEYKQKWKGKSYEHLMISVNMSRANLYVKGLIDSLVRMCQEYDVPTDEIEIEITENMFVKDSGELISFVSKLKKSGFHVSIDDFGSGYSSLNMLKDVDADVVKIDKNFLDIGEDDLKGRRIIRSIIGMCKELKFDVIAEGVETNNQIKFILECGCENAQGFYYSKPIPIEQFEEFADKYSAILNEAVRFHFMNDLQSEDGKYQCAYRGEGFTFEEGPVKGTHAIHFPGGKMETNMVKIPENVLFSESYTVMFWAKPDELKSWTSIIYVKYEVGFFSFSPLTTDGICTYRIRDSKDVHGWYDCEGKQLRENEWFHVAFSYSAKEEASTLYINGKKADKQNNVPVIRYPKRILLGGDVFKESYKGSVSELYIYYNVKNEEEIYNIYNSYLD